MRHTVELHYYSAAGEVRTAMTVHDRLIALQSEQELCRKAIKAARRDGIWTQEELDYAKVASKLFVDFFEENSVAKKILEESQDLDPKYSKVADKYFWELAEKRGQD